MSSDAKEFIDFWIKNSVHAKSEFGMTGSSQDAGILTERLKRAAEAQGISALEIIRQVGDIEEYLNRLLEDANAVQASRKDRLKR
jgi:hypothetical protein